MNSSKFNRLIRKVKTDRKAFEQIYAEYYPMIVLHIRRRFGNMVSAEDIAQDLFLKLLNLEQPGNIQYPTSWLFKLADNMAIDQIRAQRTEVPLNDFLSSPFSINSLIADDEVKKYFSCLDETTQKILYMYYWEGYSFKEIAVELNIKYGNLRVKVSRAYKKFREKM